MRIIDATVQVRPHRYETLRPFKPYLVTMRNNISYEGILKSFCLDGNALEYVVLDISGAQRIIIFGKDIYDITRRIG